MDVGILVVLLQPQLPVETSLNEHGIFIKCPILFEWAKGRCKLMIDGVQYMGLWYVGGMWNYGTSGGGSPVAPVTGFSTKEEAVGNFVLWYSERAGREGFKKELVNLLQEYILWEKNLSS
jgi:hypothetical protein